MLIQQSKPKFHLLSLNHTLLSTVLSCYTLNFHDLFRDRRFQAEYRPTGFTDGKSPNNPTSLLFVMIITIQLLKYLVKVRNSSQDRSLTRYKRRVGPES